MTRETLIKAANRQQKLESLMLNTVDVDPWVPCKIGGKVYKLEYNYPATVEIFQKTGQVPGVDELKPADILGELAAILLAGLRTHHADEFGSEINPDTEAATEKALLRRIPIRHIQYYAMVINKAFTAIAPDAEQMADILGEETESSGTAPLAVVPISGASTPNVENSESLDLNLDA